MMTLRPRSYADADLPRAQAALAGWIKDAGPCGYYHVGNLPHWIYATLRGRRPVGELVQVWEDGAHIAGIGICGLFDAAFQVFAGPTYRGTDAELAMLRVAADTTRRFLKDDPPSEAAVVTDVLSCDNVRLSLLERLGFVRYRLWDHIAERSLAEPIPEPRLPDGFRIRHATVEDAAQLALARNDAFDSGWTAEQYRDEVMRRPGYHPERELVVVAPGGQLAAFTVVWLDDINRAGLFEPVGTVRAFQRRGLARALMLHGLRVMRGAGMAVASVGYDASNHAAGVLYRSLGFSKRYETLGYRHA